MTIQLDNHGFPVMYQDDVLLADVPNAGVARVDPNAKSGNPRHDVRSGKFGTGPKRVAPKPPGNVDPEGFARMLDAARQAARQFDVFGEEDIVKFLEGRATNPEAVDVQGFINLVKMQQLNDVVDAVDQQLRTGIKFRKSKQVRVQAPKGFLKKVMGGMTAEEVASVQRRLEGLGHSADAVDKFFGGRIDSATRDAARSEKEKVTASDDWTTWEFDLEDENVEQTDVVEMAEVIAKNIQPPVIHVNPVINVEAPKPTRKEVIRDEKGMVAGVRDVEEE